MNTVIRKDQVLGYNEKREETNLDRRHSGTAVELGALEVEVRK